MSKTIKFNKYDEKSRKIIQLIDKLRDEGGDFDLDLPTVVFCGNQSAGKSSLIEAISGINLPRSGGTCTRCPMELRLSSDSEEWKCNVLLQFKYDYTNEKYLDKPYEVTFQENITDVDLVELLIRRAQKAILNPNQDSSKFKNYKFDDTTQATKTLDSKNNQLYFTENTILIKVIGAQRNLTLIDLPGIIRAAESKEEQKSIVLVEDLVKGYIKNPRSLIIATISCKDEIENQAIMSLANEVDSKGIRTIGVLTKPDTIEENCYDSWFQILNNQSFPLELGYYIIRNPNKQELDCNIKFYEARRKEEEFFNDNIPWSDASSNLKLQMGVDNLRSALSNHLTLLIEESLPNMRQKVNELFDTNTLELSTLPPVINLNSKFEFISLIRAFSIKVQEAADAKSKDKTFFQRIDSFFKTFNESLVHNRPMLHLPEIARELKKEGDTNEDNLEYYVRFNSPTSGSCFTVNTIQGFIDEQKGRELSSFIKSEAFQEIIEHCQINWNKAASDCLQKVEAETSKLLLKLIDLHFSRFKILRHRIMIKVDELVQTKFKKVTEYIRFMSDMETEFPVTWDKTTLDQTIKKVRGLYSESLTIIIDQHLAAVNYNSNNRNRHNRIYQSTSETVNSFGSKPLSSSIQSIIEISQAYYRLAQGRFGDLIPMLITKDFVHGISLSLEKFIITSLKILDTDSDDSLLEEDSRVSKKRNEVTARLERLKNIKREIET